MANFLQRISDTFFKGLPKNRPDFSHNYGYGYYRDSLWNRYGYLGQCEDINYRYECGRLESSSLVMAVCNDTGIQLSEAPPAVRRPGEDGEMEVVPDHPLSNLIGNPNPFHVWDDYTLAGAASYWIDGNWYTQIVRDASGQAVELWYLPHFMVSPRWPGDGRTPEVPNDPNLDKFISHYQYDVPGKEPVLIPANDILHIRRGVNFSCPQLGIGAFEPVITEIYGDKAAAQFTATILKNLGIVVPLVSPKDKDTTISETDAHRIKERWRQGTTGGRAGELMVNPVALDVTKFAFSPKELDLKELRMVPESRIAAVTRYPAAYLQFLVGLQNGTSYASYKEAREQAYESVIVPIQRGIARRIQQRLMPEFEKDKRAQFIFDTSQVRVLQEDQDSLVRRESEIFKSGGSTLDQYLIAVGKKPVGSPLGDVRMVPGAATPMTPDQLLGTADGSIKPEPEPMPMDQAQLAKFADMEQYFNGLEAQMKGFMSKR